MFVWESGDLSIDDGVSALADSADARRSSIPRKNSTLWFGKAIPRVWLSAGETVAVEGASARGGRVSLRIHAAADNSYRVNITLPPSYEQEWPTAGIKLRIRSPAFPAKTITSATVGGKPWADINATEETLSFGNAVPVAALQQIVVKVS